MAAAICVSALPPKADIPRRHLDVRFGPQADIVFSASYSAADPKSFTGAPRARRGIVAMASTI
jgi:hypothetical protein